MIPHQFCYLMVVLGFLWIFCMLHVTWPSQGGVTPQRPGAPEPIKPRRTRSKTPQPFAGLTQKPLCAATNGISLLQTNRRPWSLGCPRGFAHRLHLTIGLKNVLERRGFDPDIRLTTDHFCRERDDVVLQRA